MAHISPATRDTLLFATLMGGVSIVCRSTFNIDRGPEVSVKFDSHTPHRSGRTQFHITSRLRFLPEGPISG